ncbi:uncharacterized protein MELLADRAFT_110275 [Melampsora larici-populina 98AG31]|uniref:Uncharacterized protein n=1 Tax=Melampsora larici-populina (strain 98AG31 / pathotype 3-4-7) TaxID=747676 RepID=F4RZ88_MELLP|nr:uncharacterized protein MELLADRAFT_110275 [Melampsora larici-populina 98AG31]EGG02182.1 hypothetical protein MELLADRAFT_110275 [Melampsora larici-populina 98AG31]
MYNPTFIGERPGLPTFKGDGTLSSLFINKFLLDRDETIRPIGCRAMLIRLRLELLSHLGCLNSTVSASMIMIERSAPSAEWRGVFTAGWYLGDRLSSSRIVLRQQRYRWSLANRSHFPLLESVIKLGGKIVNRATGSGPPASKRAEACATSAVLTTPLRLKYHARCRTFYFFKSL